MDFVENLEMAHVVGGGGGGLVICVIMAYTFVTSEKIEHQNYD